MTLPVLYFIHIPLRKLHVEPTLATVVYWGKETNVIKIIRQGVLSGLEFLVQRRTADKH